MTSVQEPLQGVSHSSSLTLISFNSCLQNDTKAPLQGSTTDQWGSSIVQGTKCDENERTLLVFVRLNACKHKFLSRSVVVLRLTSSDHVLLQVEIKSPNRKQAMVSVGCMVFRLNAGIYLV